MSGRKRQLGALFKGEKSHHELAISLLKLRDLLLLQKTERGTKYVE
jgi:hypothetical protein